jgi:hypothetical protein
MKRFAFLAVSAALLIWGFSSYADTRSFDGDNNGSPGKLESIADIHNPRVGNLHDWVGKTREQLVAQLGQPAFTESSTTGGTFYNYNQMALDLWRGRTVVTARFEFDIDPEGIIVSAKRIANPIIL